MCIRDRYQRRVRGEVLFAMLVRVSSYWKPNNTAKASDWQTVELETSDNATAGDVKTLLRRQVEIPEDDQDLFCAGRTLQDNEQIKDLGKDPRLNLIVRMANYQGSPGSPDSRFSTTKRPSRVSHNFLTEEFTHQPLARHAPILHKPLSPLPHSPSKVLTEGRSGALNHRVTDV
eukprot:TRINITY_DN9495_c0_g2_i1.p1 TRINITY_DN9495_c0_g2~~TRINITY_DN9495_c0_g2_i1.p1  ORF type:complete len:174 (+),score=29.58 TRINITY_DN9495_c0_g2_i1:147-668(+)